MTVSFFCRGNRFSFWWLANADYAGLFDELMLLNLCCVVSLCRYGLLGDFIHLGWRVEGKCEQQVGAACTVK